MKKYTEEIVGKMDLLNDSIQVSTNIPALSALLRAKIAQGLERNITFEHKIEACNQVRLETRKIIDLIAVLGNLIDNAFDAAQSRAGFNRKVGITGNMVSNNLIFEVYNTGDHIPPEHKNKIFAKGFTTKGNTHSGLGLHIVEKLIHFHKSTIEIHDLKDGTLFRITLLF